MNFKSVDDILDFAIKNEEEAYEFYIALSKKTKPSIKKTFEDFAQEELKHKEMLLKIKEDGELKPFKGKIMDLKILESLKEDEKIGNYDAIEYADALKIAMKKEKETFLFYTKLAEKMDDENLKNTFLKLAQEEAKHKLRFEIAYDEHIYGEN